MPTGPPGWIGLAIAGGAVVAGVVIALVLGRPSPVTTGPLDCDHAIASAARAINEIAPSTLLSSGSDGGAAISRVWHDRCTADHWSSDVLACLVKHRLGANELEHCLTKLPQDSAAHLSSDMVELIRK